MINIRVLDDPIRLSEERIKYQALKVSSEYAIKSEIALAGSQI